MQASVMIVDGEDLPELACFLRQFLAKKLAIKKLIVVADPNDQLCLSTE